MKNRTAHLVALIFAPAAAVAGIRSAEYALSEIRDPGTLDTIVIQDWAPAPSAPKVRQKLVEITVCEWWQGAKVRVPVTLVAPVSGGPCRHLIATHTTLHTRPALPEQGELRLVEEGNVGVVVVGMGAIDDMQPAGKLSIEMRRRLAATKDLRYTPAWIWGMSTMRAITAAYAEADVFKPRKVMATGRSKGGMAAAAAGIHDSRITAIMALVAPPLGSPMPYALGSEPAEVIAANERFLDALDRRDSDRLPDATRATLVAREKDRNGRSPVEELRSHGWTAGEIAQLNDRAWDVSRIQPHLNSLRKRGVAVYYVVGTNDNVTPALLELGRIAPDFPVSIVPGGQHGGPTNVGFTLRVPAMPEVANLRCAFARRHFSGEAEAEPVPPGIQSHWDAVTRKLRVVVTFRRGVEPDDSRLWWSANRSPGGTIAHEYDRWDAIDLRRIAAGTYSAEISVAGRPRTLDFVSTHTVRGMPYYISSPLQRLNLGSQ